MLFIQDIMKRKKRKRIRSAKNKVKSNLTYDSYEQTLQGNKCDTVQFNSIRSKHHNIYTINQVKQSLNSYENKRFYLDSINSLPYGHYKIHI